MLNVKNEQDPILVLLIETNKKKISSSKNTRGKKANINRSASLRYYFKCLNITFLIDKDMALKKLGKLNHIIWLVKVNVCSRVLKMLWAADINVNIQRRNSKYSGCEQSCKK